jgi:hypothetical protein
MKESYDRFVTARSNFASHFLPATDLQSGQIRFVGCHYNPEQASGIKALTLKQSLH